MSVIWSHTHSGVFPQGSTNLFPALTYAAKSTVCGSTSLAPSQHTRQPARTWWYPRSFKYRFMSRIEEPVVTVSSNIAIFQDLSPCCRPLGSKTCSRSPVITSNSSDTSSSGGAPLSKNLPVNNFIAKSALRFSDLAKTKLANTAPGPAKLITTSGLNWEMMCLPTLSAPSTSSSHVYLFCLLARSRSLRSCRRSRQRALSSPKRKNKRAITTSGMTVSARKFPNQSETDCTTFNLALRSA